MTDDLEGRLRAANLKLALSDRGLSGQDNKRVARLLDSVEYDDAGEPVNVDEALLAARGVYGADVIPEPAGAPVPAYGEHAGAREGVLEGDDSTGWFAHKFKEAS